MATANHRIGSGLEQKLYALHDLPRLIMIIMITCDQRCSFVPVAVEVSCKHGFLTISWLSSTLGLLQPQG
jgi:hypothetical protein